MKRQSGNALFLILIAVALFAALSYAVTQSGRGGAGIDKETAQIQAAEIMQYVGNLDYALTRLKIINGCSETDISFYVPGVPNLEDNIHAPEVPEDCQVFHQNGGGLSYNLPSIWFDGVIDDASTATACGSGEPCLTTVRVQGVGETLDGTDLVFSLREINKETCAEINRQLGFSAISDTDETDPWIFKEINLDSRTRFKGNYAAGQRIEAFTVGASDITFGRNTGCFEGNHTNTARPGNYYFYHVLIGR